MEIYVSLLQQFLLLTVIIWAISNLLGLLKLNMITSNLYQNIIFVEVFYMETAAKRVVVKDQKKGLSISDVILVGVLLAVGAVLKFFVGSMFSAGMKPNFIIAMYCLAILLIKPRFLEAVIIGIIAGAICQVFPGTPYINLISEPVGAIVMAALVYLPLQIGKFSLKPIVGTFISTLASGMMFIGVLYAAFYTGANVKTMPISVFIVIVLGTAVINSIIVQVLYIPLKLALGRGKND